MNLYVLGAGAVGGYFGGRLAAAGFPVTFLCRGRTLQAIDRDGLRIESVDGDAHVRPLCRDTAGQVGGLRADCLIWAVKTYHNSEAIDSARPLVGPGTVVVSLQNGIDAVDELSGAFGAEKILGGFASIAAESVRPGHVRHTALGRITLGEPDGAETARVREIAGMFEKAKIPVRISKCIRRDLWGKLIWNAAFNPLSVLLRATVEDLLKNPASLSILKRAMDEAAAVAAAEGFEISPKLFESYLTPEKQSGEFRTSMLQDFLKGRPLEIDAISGAVVRRARQKGVPAPVNELFFDALRFMGREGPGIDIIDICKCHL